MRKLFLSVFVVLAVGIAVLLVVPLHQTVAMANSSSNETAYAARQAVTLYIDSVQKGNVDGMMQYSHDIRYDSESQRRNEYGQLVQYQNVQDMHITGVKAVDDSLVMVSLRWNENGTSRIMTLPVYNENGYWKVIVGGQTSA